MHHISSDRKPRGTTSSRGSIFTVKVLVLVLRFTVLVSVLTLIVLVLPSCRYCLGLVPRDQDSSRHLLKGATNLPTHQ